MDSSNRSKSGSKVEIFDDEEIKDETPTTINIIGSCVSRDIFNIKKGKKYKVEAYIHRNSLFTLFYNVNTKYKIEQFEVSDLNPHNFIQRSICTVINATASEQLLNRKGEWIVIDTFDISNPCSIIKYPDGDERLVQCVWIDQIKKVYERTSKFKQCKFIPIDASVNMNYFVDEVVDFLKENWGNNIILINPSRAVLNLNRNGILQQDDIVHIENQQRSNKMTELLLRRLDCHYIEMPSVMIRDSWFDSDNGNDCSPVHYITEIYEYLKETIDAIIGKSLLDPCFLNGIRAKFNLKINNILLGEWASEKNTLRRVNALIKGENGIDEECTIKDLKKLINQENPESYMAIARLYHTGTYFEKKLNVSAEWMRKAVDKNVIGAKNELSEILLRIGTPESYKEMISIVTKFAEEGNGGAMARLGRAYRDGKGVEKDLNMAADWMRKGVEKNIGWAKNELFDILWRIGTPESYKEMISIVTKFAEEGNGGAMARLGRAYRDGKGVEKDLNMAADWMRKGVEKNIGWAKNELFDILWRIGTPESYKEMISIVTKFAEEGNGGAMARLGRAYRDGKGVEKDLNMAADWMRKGVEKNIGWAKNELFDILWRIGTPESYKEMISIVTKFAEEGDGGAMARLGRAYRDGKGVEKDLNMAADWMRKGVEKNIGWAKNELFDILWRIGTPESYKEINAAVKKGNAVSMAYLGFMYRDGKGVEKNLDKALECMRKSMEGGYAKITNDLLSLLSDSSERVDEEIDRIKKINDGPFSVKLELDNNRLRSDLEGSEFDYYIATLFRDGNKVSELKSKSLAEIWAIEESGIYHIKFKIVFEEETFNINSVPIEYFTKKYIEEFNKWLDSDSQLQTPLDFYAANEPYQDFLIISNGLKPKKHVFSDNKFKRKIINNGTCEIIHNGEIHCTDKTNVVFSGVSVVGDSVCFGSGSLNSFGVDNMSGYTGDFTMVSDEPAGVKIFTDYFGMGKLYYYVSGKEFCVSNRLHLIISYLPFTGVKLKISNRGACAPFYVRGVLGEQPVNEDTVVEGIHLLSPAKSIFINKGKISFVDTDFYNVLISPSSYSEEYKQQMLSDAVEEVTDGIRAVINLGRFDKYIIDVTGGLDSRMSISALSRISNSKLNTYVRTYGDYNEIKCGSNLVKEMGYSYDASFMKFSKSFDLNKFNGVPWISDKEYLDLLTSTMYDSFDFSARVNNIFNASNIAVITGNAGEAVSRPYARMNIIHKISFYDGIDHFVDRIVEDLSHQALTGYESCGKLLRDQLFDSFNTNPCDTLEKKWEGIYLFFRNRFHFNLSHKISYSTFNWTPLMSKSLFKLFYSSNDNFKDFNLVNKFLENASHSAYTSEYSSYYYNLEMIKSINKLGVNKSLKIRTYDGITEDFNESVNKEKEITVDVKSPDLDIKDEIDLCKNTLSLLNYVVKGNKEIRDLIGLPVFHEVNKINNKYDGAEKYKRVYHLYKKVASIAYAKLAINNKDSIVIKYMIPSNFYCGKDSIIQIDDNSENVKR